MSSPSSLSLEHEVDFEEDGEFEGGSEAWPASLCFTEMDTVKWSTLDMCSFPRCLLSAIVKQIEGFA